MSEPTQATGAPAEPGAVTEPGVEADDADTTTIVVVGLVSSALVLATALGVAALYDATVSSIVAGHEENAANKPQPPHYAEYDWTADALNRQQIAISGTKAVDASAGHYTIPIERAMSLVVKEMHAEQQAAREGAPPTEPRDNT